MVAIAQHTEQSPQGSLAGCLSPQSTRETPSGYRILLEAPGRCGGQVCQSFEDSQMSPGDRASPRLGVGRPSTKPWASIVILTISPTERWGDLIIYPYRCPTSAFWEATQNMTMIIVHDGRMRGLPGSHKDSPSLILGTHQMCFLSVPLLPAPEMPPSLLCCSQTLFPEASPGSSGFDLARLLRSSGLWVLIRALSLWDPLFADCKQSGEVGS